MKRIASTLAALMIPVFLTACGTTQPPTTPAPSSPPPAEGQSPAAPSVDQWIPLTGAFEGAASKPVTLRFLDEGGAPWDAGHAELIAEFERQYPNIKIQREAVPHSQITKKIQVEIAASSPPDVLMIDGPEVTSYAAQGALLAIDEYLRAEDKDDFYPSSLLMGTWQDQLYGLPSEQSAHMIYYREDAFAEAGIEVPNSLENGWKWPEARDAFEKVTEVPPGGGLPTRYGLDRLSGDYVVGTIIRSLGDPNAPKDSTAYKTYAGISDDGMTVVGYQDTPEVVQGLQFFQDMYQNNIMPKSAIPDAMPTGMAAARIVAEFIEGKLNSQFQDVNWSIAPMPYFNTPIVHTGSIAFTVSARTKHPKEAALFILWMTSAKAEKVWFTHNPSLPARRSVARDIDAYQTLPKSVTLQSFEQWGTTRVRTPIYSQYNSLVNEMHTNLIAGGDVAKEVSLLTEKVQATLDQFWSRRK